MGGTRLYCMIALILAGAAFLTLAWATSACRATWPSGSRTLGLSQLQLIVALMLFYVVLGCFLDGISMVVLTMGVILPTVQKAGIDPLWFGIFIVLVVEMAQITPPVGFNLFVLQGMTRREIGWIARVTLPFFLLMVAAVGLIYAVPADRHLRCPRRCAAERAARAGASTLDRQLRGHIGHRASRATSDSATTGQCRPRRRAAPDCARLPACRTRRLAMSDLSIAAAVPAARWPRCRAAEPTPSRQASRSPGRRRRLPATRRRAADRPAALRDRGPRTASVHAAAG